jgi:hypothetical protein
VGTDAAHGTPQLSDLQNPAALPKSQTVDGARLSEANWRRKMIDPIGCIAGCGGTFGWG